MEDNRPKPRIAEETFEVPCRIHGCFNRAKYKLGNIEGSPGILFHVCEHCMDSMLKRLPEELKSEPVIVEVTKEVQVPFAEVETVKEQAIVKKEVEVKKAPVKKKGSK